MPMPTTRKITECKLKFLAVDENSFHLPNEILWDTTIIAAETPITDNTQFIAFSPFFPSPNLLFGTGSKWQ